MRFLLTLLTLLAFSQPAFALVMCGRKDRAGGIASGAAVKLRETCRSTETEIDPDAMGLRGPKGEPGEPGTPGVQGPGMIARDANGNVLGPFFPTDTGPTDAGVVIFAVGDKTMRVHVNTDGTIGSGTPDRAYESTDCSGTALIGVAGAAWWQPLFPSFLKTADGQGIIIPGPASIVQPRSRFTYPENRCEQVSWGASLYAPPVTVPIATPLTIEQVP